MELTEFGINAIMSRHPDEMNSRGAAAFIKDLSGEDTAVSPRTILRWIASQGFPASRKWRNAPWKSAKNEILNWAIAKELVVVKKEDDDKPSKPPLPQFTLLKFYGSLLNTIDARMGGRSSLGVPLTEVILSEKEVIRALLDCDLLPIETIHIIDDCCHTPASLTRKNGGFFLTQPFLDEYNRLLAKQKA